MPIRQRLSVAVGISLIAIASLFLPCESPGGLLCNGLTFVPLGTPLTDADTELKYLPQLHWTLVVFFILLTVLVTVANGGGTRRRQVETASLAVPALTLLGIVSYPSSGALFCGAYMWPESFVGSADVILALILTFMLYLRNDPV